MEEKGYLPNENEEGYESDDPEDPRTLKDLEKENIDLKEQMIHQILTLEQYIGVANMWMVENRGGSIFIPNDDEQSHYAQASQTMSHASLPVPYVGQNYTLDQMNNVGENEDDYLFHPEEE